jgi:2-polyprenyl-3-methyl-5-hydroxy-6-metoxy-1,4-benzoquinol methylase
MRKNLISPALPGGPPVAGASPGAVDPRADARGRKIGILIVAYNAVTTLTKVLQRIPAGVWDNVAEVVVFDDASQDATYELGVGYKITRQVEKLHVLRHSENLGYGGNQKAGYRYFLDKGFDVVVLLHGDGQYAPEILSHLYHPIVSGEADAVFGSRMIPGQGGALKGGMPLYKYAGNRILSAFENAALGLDLTEFHSGYRAYSLRALREIDMSRMTGDFHFDTEIIIKLHHQGFRIREVPIPTYYGNEICYVNGIRYAWDVVKAVRRYRRTAASLARFPEFQEYWVHYPVKESKGSSHFYLWRLAGTNQRILDVGCGDGLTAAKLAEAGNRVTGIDVLPAPKNLDKLEDYVCWDLSSGLEPLLPRFGARKFDKVLLMDVLEHLADPAAVLRPSRDLLEPRGEAIISVPNVANVTVRLMLLLGRFDYAERGILDRTHVRFYTRRTARRMIEACGFTIAREIATVMPVELALGISPANPLMRAANWLLRAATRLLPRLLGYQWIFVAKPAAPLGSCISRS